MFMRLHINMTNDFVLDLSELNLISITKSLVELENLMTDRYKKLLIHKIKFSAKTNKRHEKFIYFSEEQRFRNTLH